MSALTAGGACGSGVGLGSAGRAVGCSAEGVVAGTTGLGEAAGAATEAGGGIGSTYALGSCLVGLVVALVSGRSWQDPPNALTTAC